MHACFDSFLVAVAGFFRYDSRENHFKAREMFSLNARVGSFYVLVAGTLWGSMGVFVRHFNAVGLGTMEIAWYRNLFGLLTVGCWLLLKNRTLLKFRIKDLWCFLGTGLGSLFLLNVTYYTAMQFTSLAVAGVLLYTAPIFVMLLSALFFRETVTRRKLIALVLAFVGCALVSGIGSDSRISTPGLLWGLGAGITYALYSIFSRFAIDRGYGSWTITFWSFVLSFLASSCFSDRQLLSVVWQQPAELGWAAAMGVVTNFLPYVLYGMGLQTIENGRASILASVEPVVAALFSLLLFREPMGMTGALGIGLVLGAILILSRQKETDANKVPL